MEQEKSEFEETLENSSDNSVSSKTENDELDASNETSSTEMDDVEKLKKINSQLYARLKKLEAKLKDEKVVTKDDVYSRVERLEFRVNHPEISEEHLEFLEALANGKNISLEDAYKMPVFQKIVQKDADEQKLAKAVSGGKTSSEEIKTILQEAKEVSKDQEKHKEFWKKLSA